MLGNQAHEGLQPPSNPEERKGLKEAQHAAHVRSAAHPHPPSRTRGVSSASLEGSPSKPSTAPRVWWNHPKLLGPGALIFVAKQL